MPVLIKAIQAGEVSATIDLWREPYTQLDYFTVTAHYFDESWKLCMQVLLIVPLSSDEKSGVNIKDDVKTKLGLLGITEEDFSKSCLSLMAGAIL